MLSEHRDQKRTTVQRLIVAKDERQYNAFGTSRPKTNNSTTAYCCQRRATVQCFRNIETKNEQQYNGLLLPKTSDSTMLSEHRDQKRTTVQRFIVAKDERQYNAFGTSRPKTNNSTTVYCCQRRATVQCFWN